MIYGLNNRNEQQEMESRYNAMVGVLSDILNCGRWDIEELFDSENNIDVGEIINTYVDEIGTIPDWNAIYYEAMINFANEHDLVIGKDVDIYTNACLDTCIYAREGLDEDIVNDMEDLFNMEADTLNN